MGEDAKVVKSAAVEGGSEAALAREILDPREAYSTEGRKKESPMLNLLALLLVLAGAAVLVLLYFYYFNGK